LSPLNDYFGFGLTPQRLSARLLYGCRLLQLTENDESLISFGIFLRLLLPDSLGAQVNFWHVLILSSERNGLAVLRY